MLAVIYEFVVPWVELVPTVDTNEQVENEHVVSGKLKYQVNDTDVWLKIYQPALKVPKFQYALNDEGVLAPVYKQLPL